MGRGLPFTEEQIAQMRTLAKDPELSIADIADIVGRSVGGVGGLFSRLKIKRPKASHKASPRIPEGRLAKKRPVPPVVTPVAQCEGMKPITRAQLMGRR